MDILSNAEDMKLLKESQGLIKIPLGKYKVTKNFKMGLGAWSTTFKEGDLIQIASNGRPDSYQVRIFNPLNGKWDDKGNFGGRGNVWSPGAYNQRDANGLTQNFISGTKKLSADEFEKLKNSGAKEKVIKVKDFAKFVEEAGLKKTSKIKITVEG